MSRKSVHPDLQFEYEEFRARADPFGLAEEVALARTLITEFRESVTNHNREKAEGFAYAVAGDCAQLARDAFVQLLNLDTGNPEVLTKLNKLEAALSEKMQSPTLSRFQASYGLSTGTTPEQARTLASLLKTVADLAEKYRKIAEGVSLRVEYNPQVMELLAKFLAMCVLPFCTTEQKAIMSERALKFLPQWDARGFETLGGAHGG